MIVLDPEEEFLQDSQPLSDDFDPAVEEYISREVSHMISRFGGLSLGNADKIADRILQLRRDLTQDSDDADQRREPEDSK